MKPISSEDEYFARQEVEQKRRWAKEREAQLITERGERSRDVSFMKCPKCGAHLEEIAFGGVRIDKCFGCEGIWLDKGELDMIRKKKAGFLGTLLKVFR
jgi:hypothetical protein